MNLIGFTVLLVCDILFLCQLGFLWLCIICHCFIGRGFRLYALLKSELSPTVNSEHLTSFSKWNIIGIILRICVLGWTLKERHRCKLVMSQPHYLLFHNT